MSRSLALLALILIHATAVRGQSHDEIGAYRQVSDFFEENENCFRCHALTNASWEDPVSGQLRILELDSNHVVRRDPYYRSNHRGFSCFDCHDRAFSAYPHPLKTSQEVHWNCLDCHGYDEDYAHYQFERIEQEYLKSIHHLARPDSFSCWKCHDPHAYHISIRTAENLAAAIDYDNEICLACHNHGTQAQVHGWLPNQTLHFKAVRCIECHTSINDSMLVAHLVTPAEQSVHNCRQCHSRNSLLMATLYRYQSAENRSKYGFLNAAIMNEAYVIGANRNYFLNLGSLVIFGLVLLGIGIHLALRIQKKA